MNKNTFCLFIVLLTINCHSQWRTGSSGNKFDGEYKYGTIIGKGGEYPYTKPSLTINKFKNVEPNIYISNIGYTGCNNNSLKFAFDNSEDIYSFYSETNADKDAAFLSATVFETKELLELFKQKSKVYIRYSNSCGKEDYEFSLNGATKAINFIVGNYYEKEIEAIKDEIREKRIIDSLHIAERKLLENRLRKVDSIKSVNEIIIANAKTIEFEKTLLEAFDFNGLEMSKSQLITLMEFNTNKTIKATYCQKQFDSGVTVRNRETAFYKSDNFKLYNRIEEGCIRMDLFTKGTKRHTIYISNTELQKLSNDPRIKIISKNWISLLNSTK